VRITGLEQFIQTVSEKRCIVMLWHNRLAVIAEILNKHAPQFIYAAFISKSRDGEPLALIANSYRAGRAIRVPHQAKHQALKIVIETLKRKKQVILFTPDGPRGPRYKIKPGIILAAKEAEAVIIPFTWTADRFWTLKTWDQFRLPRPFSTLSVSFGQPWEMHVGGTIDEAIGSLEESISASEETSQRNLIK
jgi:lysophospholipid acyltransferase (LPLAT)-like uncharacterized protein